VENSNPVHFTYNKNAPLTNTPSVQGKVSTKKEPASVFTHASSDYNDAPWLMYISQ